MNDTRWDFVNLPRSLNWRDLGGLTTQDGRSIAAGRLYRSAELSQLSAACVSTLVSHTGLRTVIDLRMSSERGGEQTVQSLQSLYLRRPLFEQALDDWAYPTDHSPKAGAQRYWEMLEAGAGAMIQIVQTLGAINAYPVLIHCAAGRDRTGIVIACLLDLLEVADEAIAADYALSVSDSVAHDGGRVQGERILCFLNLIRQKHGSTREWLRTHGAPEGIYESIAATLLVERDGAQGTT